MEGNKNNLEVLFQLLLGDTNKGASLGVCMYKVGREDGEE